MASAQKSPVANSGKPVKDLKALPSGGTGAPLAQTLAQTAQPPQAGLRPGARPPAPPRMPPPPRQPPSPPPGPIMRPPGAPAGGPMSVRPPIPAAGGQPPIFSPLSVGAVPGAAPPKYSNSDLGEILSKLYRG
jgi:hypothetical protein